MLCFLREELRSPALGFFRAEHVSWSSSRSSRGTSCALEWPLPEWKSRKTTFPSTFATFQRCLFRVRTAAAMTEMRLGLQRGPAEDPPGLQPRDASCDRGSFDRGSCDRGSFDRGSCG